MPRKSPLCSSNVICFSLSILMSSFCLILICGVYEVIFYNILSKKYQVTPGSEVEDIWVTTPVPLVMKVYVFNLTNPDEFTNGDKPILQELGPYVYREYHKKENIKYHVNKTVSYYQKRWWHHDQELSGNCSLDDVVYTVNTIPVSAAFQVEAMKMSSLTLDAVDMVFESIGEKSVVQATVSEILFDGFEDPLLNMVNNSIFPNIIDFLPEGLSDYDKFAWFYKRNNSITYDGHFNMYTGETSVEKVGRIDLWNYSNVTEFFGEPCNHVTGSAGELWPPGIEKDIIKFYNPDLCMTATLYYLREEKDSYGFPCYRFYGSNETFANSTYKPEHECLCVNGNCGPNGLLNAQSCRMGAPAYVSFPHFLNADPKLLDNVIGLKPDPEKHQFYIDLNPELGIPLRVAARMQINMHVKPYPGKGGLFNMGKITILEKVPDVILPMIWFEVLTEMSDDLAKDLKPAIFFSSSWPIIIFSCLFIAGVLFVLVSGYRIMTAKNKNEKDITKLNLFLK